MRKNSDAKGKKRRGKGYLRIAFASAAAAAALFTGVGALHAFASSPGPATGAGSSSSTIDVFGAAAHRVAWASGNMEQMLQRQQDEMKIPANAQEYNKFLAGFDTLKNMPSGSGVSVGPTLAEMAIGVHTAVQDKIAYSDTQYSNEFTYWASPFQTIKTGKADCKAFSSLEYSILRSLGIPADRLFFASVNAFDKSNVSNHIVLLMNVAPEGQPQKFLVLDNRSPEPVMASVYGQDYKLYDVFNPTGYWQTATAKAIEGSVPAIAPAAGGSSRIALASALSGATFALGEISLLVVPKPKRRENPKTSKPT